jgi:hypothetical protein
MDKIHNSIRIFHRTKQLFIKKHIFFKTKRRINNFSVKNVLIFFCFFLRLEVFYAIFAFEWIKNT